MKNRQGAQIFSTDSTQLIQPYSPCIHPLWSNWPTSLRGHWPTFWARGTILIKKKASNLEQIYETRTGWYISNVQIIIHLKQSRVKQEINNGYVPTSMELHRILLSWSMGAKFHCIIPAILFIIYIYRGKNPNFTIIELFVWAWSWARLERTLCLMFYLAICWVNYLPQFHL